MAKLSVVLLAAIVLLLVVAAHGNLLVWTDPFQACIGWPDDAVYSWWCTPDLTVRGGM